MRKLANSDATPEEAPEDTPAPETTPEQPDTKNARKIHKTMCIAVS